MSRPYLCRSEKKGTFFLFGDRSNTGTIKSKKERTSILFRIDYVHTITEVNPNITTVTKEHCQKQNI